MFKSLFWVVHQLYQHSIQFHMRIKLLFCLSLFPFSILFDQFFSNILSIFFRSWILHSTAVYVLIANSCYQEFRAKAYCLSQVLAGFLKFFVFFVLYLLWLGAYLFIYLICMEYWETKAISSQLWFKYVYFSFDYSYLCDNDLVFTSFNWCW